MASGWGPPNSTVAYPEITSQLFAILSPLSLYNLYQLCGASSTTPPVMLLPFFHRTHQIYATNLEPFARLTYLQLYEISLDVDTLNDPPTHRINALTHIELAAVAVPKRSVQLSFLEVLCFENVDIGTFTMITPHLIIPPLHH